MLSKNDIVNIAYSNELYYSTEFCLSGRTVIVFSVYSLEGLKTFKEQLKNYFVEKVIDPHNENYLIGVMI